MQEKIKKWALLPAILFLILALGTAVTFYLTQPTKAVEIGDTTIKVYVVDSEEERQQGLSGRSHLASGTGMLFIYEQNGEHGIWMKDMKFPIDIVWLDENRTVVTIKQLVSPDTYPEVFSPSVPARYVLELPAGTAQQYGIQTGQQLIF